MTMAKIVLYRKIIILLWVEQIHWHWRPQQILCRRHVPYPQWTYATVQHR